MDEVSRIVDDLMSRFSAPAELVAEVEKLDATDDRKGELLREIGKRQHSLSHFEGALFAWEQGRAHYARSGNQIGEATCLRDSGEANRAMGRPPQGIELVEQALTMTRRLGDQSLESTCLASLGTAYATVGDLPKAEDAYEAGLRLAIETGTRSIEQACLQNLSVIRFLTARFHEALEYNARCLDVVRQIKDLKGQATCWTNAGVIYSTMNDHTRAVEQYEKALALYRQIGFKAGEIACRTNIALASIELKNFARAIDHLKESLQSLADMNDRKAESCCYDNLGIAYFHVGDPLTAIKNYHRALEIKREIKDKIGRAAVFANLGEVHESVGDLPRAIEYYQSALTIYEESDNAYGLRACLAEEGRILLRRADFPGAAELLNRAAGVLETLRAKGVPKEYRRSFWKDNVTIFDDLVWADVKSGSPDLALQHSEQAKGRAVADVMLDRGLAEGEIAPAWLSSQEIRDLARRIGRNLVLLRVTEQGAYAFTLTPAGGFDLIEMPEFDRERLSMLLVQIRRERPVDGWVFHYTNYKSIRGLDSRGEGVADDLRDAELLNAAETNWFRAMDQTLKTLHTELLGRVFERLPTGEKVTIIPNRALSVLPLHAAFSEQEDRRRYLIDDYEISYAPNCGILDLCFRREAEMRSRNSLIAVANPVPPHDLVFAEWEVDEIAKLFPAERRQVITRQEAKAGLLDPISEYGVVHLATHGFYDLGSNFNSRLLLGSGKEGELTLDEILTKVRLAKNWLVTLSACESGLTDYRDVADEYIGLQTGFLHAGAPTVFASLWVVNDFTSAMVMIKTYELIVREHRDKTAALRSAQLWLRGLTAREATAILKEKELALVDQVRMARQDILPLKRLISLADPDSRPFAHPYYWAGFQAFGA
jgi:CHAT domain-containing protein/tetratricopeptide (TPR) repeat protein